jgi:hypothetical protein
VGIGRGGAHIDAICDEAMFQRWLDGTRKAGWQG